MKRKSTSAFISLMMLLTLGLTTGCGSNDTSLDSEPSSSDTELIPDEVGLTLSEESLVLKTSETKKLTATTNYDKGFLLTWNSSDKRVAVVNDGVVTGVDAGTATITVSARKLGELKVLEMKKCTVTVLPGQGIALNKSELNLTLGVDEPVKLEATIIGFTGTAKWSSTKESVATVDQTGLVTPVGVGDAIISATIEGFSADCLVKVSGRKIAIEKVLNLNIDEEKQITSEVPFGEDAVWSSDDETIATVDQTGLVKAIKPGMTTVSVESKKEGLSASCVVIVKENKEEAKVMMSGNKSFACENFNNWVYLKPSANVETSKDPIIDDGLMSFNLTHVGGNGGDNNFYLRYQPDKDGGVTYNMKFYIYVDNQVTVSINNQPDQILNEGLNIVNLTFISSPAANHSPLQFKIKSAAQYHILPIISVEGVSNEIEISELSHTLNLLDPQNNSFTLTATAQNNSKITWSSSDDKVASVDQNGLVSAVGVGNADIIASANGKSSKCSVRVISKALTETDLVPGLKSEVCNTPDTWFFFADGVASKNDAPTIDSETGIITYNIANISTGKNLAYLRYQPAIPGTYTVKMSINLAGSEESDIDISGGSKAAEKYVLTTGDNTIEFTFDTTTSNPFQIKFRSLGVYKLKVEFQKA